MSTLKFLVPGATVPVVGTPLQTFLDANGEVRHGTPVQEEPRELSACPGGCKVGRSEAIRPVRLVDIPPVQLLRYSVSAGRIGLGGSAGVGRAVRPRVKGCWYNKFISAWGPSLVEIRNTRPIELAGFIDKAYTEELYAPVTFCADGNLVGHVASLEATTIDSGKKFRLEPGTHLLEVIILNGRSEFTPATVWGYHVIEE